MLVIRKEQIHAFNQTLLRRWIASYLQSCYPEATAAHEPFGLSALVDQAISRAKACGIETDEDIRKYAHLTFILGFDFEELPWVAALWDDPECWRWRERLEAVEAGITDRIKAANHA
jgi:hypothetical protein